LLTLAIETSSKSIATTLLDGSQLLLSLDSNDSPDLGSPMPRTVAGATDKLPAGYVRKRSKGKSKTSRVFPPGASVLLAPMIKRLFAQTQLKIQDVDLVAVASGPGAFTGLRVGVVTAKVLAYSADADLIGVNTLEVIAAQAFETMGQEIDFSAPDRRILPVVNAQRQQLFVGNYACKEPWNPTEIGPNQILDRESWLQSIRPSDILTGPGLGPLLDSIHSNLGENQSGNSEPIESPGPNAIVAPESCRSCLAESVGRLALRKHADGFRSSLWELEPLYFRPSSAEEIAIKNAEQLGLG
jgi:tRNA threonylcarbamoyladenosine biosynthesis protein TsaB